MDDTSNTTKRNVCSLSIALSNTEITKKLYGIFLLLPAVEWLFTLLERAYLAFNYILMYSAGLDVYMSLKVCVVVFFCFCSSLSLKYYGHHKLYYGIRLHAVGTYALDMYTHTLIHSQTDLCH